MLVEPRQLKVTDVGPVMVQWTSCGGPTGSGGTTVTVTESGVGSESPAGSVTVSLTVYAPAVASTIGPGSSTVWSGAAPPRLQASTRGESPSGSEPVPASVKVSPTVRVVSPAGMSMVPLGARLGRGST